MIDMVFLTQVIDAKDPTLGFVTSWVGALAARSASVTAVANEVRGTPAFPANVHVVSLGKERGAGKMARGAALQRAVATAPGDRPVVLAHMCPIYLDLAAPIAAVRRMPTMLWFAHPSVTPALRVAERVADVVLTSLPGAYPRPGPTVRVLGQATDTDRIWFDGSRVPRAGEIDLLAIGRTSPSKGFDHVIRALAKARADGIDATLRIVGPSTTQEERAHARDLAKLIAVHDLGSVVSLEPGLAPHEVDGVIRSADVLVSAMVSGSGDKVVFEAMAAGRLPLVSNAAFGSLLADLPLDLTFERDDEGELAERIVTLAATDVAVIEDARRSLRGRVEADHSLGGWADKVVAIAEDLR